MECPYCGSKHLEEVGYVRVRYPIIGSNKQIRKIYYGRVEVDVETFEMDDMPHICRDCNYDFYYDIISDIYYNYNGEVVD